MTDLTTDAGGDRGAGLLAAYRGVDGAFDEMVGAAGGLREHWGRVGNALGELGVDQLLQRRRDAHKLLDDDGVTYNVYGGNSGATNRWDMDPLPLVLSSEEWGTIERGVIQRAELLDAVLQDLYGSRQLITRGLVPPEVVYGHPGFLRTCVGIRLPGPQQLVTMAADIGRDATGQPWVLSDRSQAPSGAGYALENRVVASRVFPSLYREAQVHRLAPFFRSLRAALQAAAPAGVDNPRIVVLTPGPWSETSFEHAFLASYLGYPLVQGGDLLVRGGSVYMRSLGRPEPVHVILRRVDDWFCDPLELRPDSQLGAPGLVEAARLGTVSVVNTLGSGVLENAALLPFLPRLSQELLGEELRLPSVPTYWCGESACESHVLANLEALVIKPVSRDAGATTAFGWELSVDARDELRRRIRARPDAWVGQEPLSLATVPTLGDDGLEARRFVLRAFAVARHQSYAAMPGGLARVAQHPDSMLVSNQRGSISKDTWVLASEPEPQNSFWATRPGDDTAVLDAVGSTVAMSTRAAENLFWLARYAERAEGTLRLLRAIGDRRNDFEHGVNPAGTACLRALLEALTHVSATYPGFVGDGAEARLADPGAELLAIVGDERRTGSLAHALRRMMDAALEVRDQLSGDTWLVVGNIDRDMALMRRRLPEPGSAVVPPGVQNSTQAMTGRVLQSLLAFAGLAAESMVRDAGWRFMDAGRRIERGLQLSALARATLTMDRDTATDSLLWESVLTSAESIITYRRRYRSHAQIETMLELLLLDDGNPRSLAFQLDRLAEDLRELPGSTGRNRRSSAERQLIELSATLQVADLGALAAEDGNGDRPALRDFLDHAISRLSRIADVVDETHFSHPLPQHSVFQGPGPTREWVS